MDEVLVKYLTFPSLMSTCSAGDSFNWRAAGDVTGRDNVYGVRYQVGGTSSTTLRLC